VRESEYLESDPGCDLGKAGLYLLGDLSDGVTGETIHVDCGFHIMGP